MHIHHTFVTAIRVALKSGTAARTNGLAVGLFVGVGRLDGVVEEQ